MPAPPTYYSPSAILTDAEKVPTTFSLELPGLGYLDENPGEDIPPNTSLPLPLWLATLLAVQRINPTSSLGGLGGPSTSTLATLDIPPSIASSKTLNALRADARVVDLRGLCGNWFDLAGRVMELWVR